MHNLTALILDDDPICQKLHLSILREYCPEISYIQTSGSINDTLKQLANRHFNLLFLDIEVGKENLMQYGNFLQSLPKETKVIIVSGYMEYALKAIKVGVLDYILKPADPYSMINAVQKYLNCQQNKTEKPLVLNGHSKTYLIKKPDVIMLVAEGAYTNFYLPDGILSASKSLGHFSPNYLEYPFFRLSRSHIININHIIKIEKEGNGAGTIYFEGNYKLKISKLKKDELVRYLHNL